LYCVNPYSPPPPTCFLHLSLTYHHHSHCSFNPHTKCREEEYDDEEEEEEYEEAEEAAEEEGRGAEESGSDDSDSDVSSSDEEGVEDEDTKDLGSGEFKVDEVVAEGLPEPGDGVPTQVFTTVYHSPKCLLPPLFPGR